ncbi:MAG: leucine-rich repeat domain-containing protein [Lachnospiraceae bacterium]|uniref:Leucine-rich repeat domain-containing protein n=1 Tax=Candidatus Weimeria bifida TaxID=2599074 RepID=A0A6N7J2V4_9FIRM|nr:leucine-rich repeat domain-containing protein [Candidatus Weimeria bifida]RRF96396.1 MAG: leucine-rich repeat domain-containing protein [Lachnospiraceae bacterium]
MKKSTRIGWILITLALVMGVWALTSHNSQADQTTNAGFVLSDDGSRLKSYQGSGGSVTVPSGVTTIDSGVFANNTSITNVSLPNSVTTLGSRVFAGATNLRSVSLGNVTSIPAQTFQNCMSLTQVSIPSTVTSIGSQAFYGCAALGSVSVPDSVSSISTDAFGECNNLTSISASNSFYSSYDGCLYNASGSRLILVPPGKSSISFSSNMKSIGAGSFSYNKNIRTVSVPGTADSIEAGAFTNSAVNSITIPKSVVQIGSQGNWKPNELYGYQNSEAATYASNNGITFIALDPGTNSSSDTDDSNSSDDSSDISNNDDPDDPEDESDDESSASGNASKKKNGAGVLPNKGSKGGGTAGGGSSTAGGRGGSYNGKDITPKTADPNLDPRYAMCGVLLLLGIFVMVSGNKKKLTLVNQEKDR